jgi:hypothetical protein
MSAIATTQLWGKASLAMKTIVPGIITKSKLVSSKAVDSMRVNSEKVSNEIDESDLQWEKHDESSI